MLLSVESWGRCSDSLRHRVPDGHGLCGPIWSKGTMTISRAWVLLRGYGPRLIGGLKVLVKGISKLEMGCHTIRHRWNLNLENQKTKINETKHLKKWGKSFTCDFERFLGRKKFGWGEWEFSSTIKHLSYEIRTLTTHIEIWELHASEIWLYIRKESDLI